ncbi:MAG: nucleotidyltransferase family protein [Promethearchaeota archaeon]
MVKDRIISQIKSDFRFILENKSILGVILYGSYLSGDESNRSDIDICIVASDQNLYQIHKYIYKNLENNLNKYDIHFFEELPLYIQGGIIEEGIVILTHDLGELSEYFYPFRKQWLHEKWRIERVA